MSVSLTCDCGARFELENLFSGQTFTCPECQTQLHTPASTSLPIRTSFLALLALILAIVGAPTIVGSIAAIILGILALGQIRREGRHLVGVGLARTGILLGLIGLVATSGILFGWIGLPSPTIFLTNSVPADPDGSLEHRDAANKFTITRSSRSWGTANRESHGDPILFSLQAQDSALLLVHREKPVYIDVAVDANQFRTLEECEALVLEEFTTGSQDNDQVNRPNPNFNLDREHFFLRSLVGSPKHVEIPPLAGTNCREIDLTTRYALRNWPFRIRLYKKGDRLYTVRAYARSNKDMEAVKDEVDQILDSFRISK